jgi:hypothetical protein
LLLAKAPEAVNGEINLEQGINCKYHIDNLNSASKKELADEHGKANLNKVGNGQE